MSECRVVRSKSFALREGGAEHGNVEIGETGFPRKPERAYLFERLLLFCKHRYIAQHGKPKTLEVQTPTKGFHYYSNYPHSDPYCQAMIKAHLRNSTKFRRRGIDIRREGGFTVAPPSERNDGAYEVTNDRKPIDIPSPLITWLLEGSPRILGEATAGSPRTPNKASTPQRQNTQQMQQKLRYKSSSNERTNLQPIFWRNLSPNP